MAPRDELVEELLSSSESQKRRRCFPFSFSAYLLQQNSEDAFVGADEEEEKSAVVLTPSQKTRRPRWPVGLAVATIGCASLFAWNAIITASAYFGKRFCGSLIARDYESVFSVTYQLTSVAANLYAARITEELSAEERVVPRLKGLAWIFFTFTLLACWPSAPRDAVFVPLSLLGTALAGALSQALCSALYGITTALPSIFMSWNMAGQAVGGLIPAVIVVVEALVSKAQSRNDDDETDDGCRDKGDLDLSAVGYFAAACALFLLSIAAFRFLEKASLYKAAVLDPADRRMMVTTAEGPFTSTNTNEDDASVQGEETTVFFGGEVPSTTSHSSSSLERRDDEDESSTNVTSNHNRRVMLLNHHTYRGDFLLMIELAKIVAVPAAAVFWVFCVTLMVFPTLTALARPRGHADDDDASLLYVPLLFLLFNVGDFVGRGLAPHVPAWLQRPSLLLGLSLLRVGFVPLILMGELNGSDLAGPSFLKETYVPVVIMVAFSVSNGVLATLAMAAAAPLSPKRHKELVGNVMSLFLTVGLACGSFLSFAMLAIVDGSSSKDDA